MNSYNIYIEQGASLNLSLTASDSGGNLLNLSGYNATGQVQYGYGSTGILLNLNPQIDPGFVSGIINISVPSNQTTGLPVTKAIFEIDIYNTTGYMIKVLGGYFDINPGICF
jgi:hypothetical protein